MKNEDLKSSNLIINKEAIIKDAMTAINDNQRGAVIVIDDNFNLVGVISDGDIRRVLIKDREVYSQISDIVNLNPTSVKEDVNKQAVADKIFTESQDINILPVVNENNVVVDIIIRDPEKRK